VAPTPAKARERARAVLGRNYVQHQYPNRIGTVQMASTKLDPSMADDAVTVDYLMENVWIVGDPAECADKIRQLHAESGGVGTPHGLRRAGRGPGEPAPAGGGRGAPDCRFVGRAAGGRGAGAPPVEARL